MNNIKKTCIIGITVVLFVSSFFLVSCKTSQETHAEHLTAQKTIQEKEIVYYTCGMHPSVRISPEDYEKGNTSCPICNMGLVPVYKEDQTEKMKRDEHKEDEEMEREIKLSQRARMLAGVKTEEILFRHLFREINTVGEVDYDERRMASVSSWVAGRIDKLYVDFTGVQVKKGNPLVWIYSPDLVTTQQEYLLALETVEKVKESPYEETVAGAHSLVEAAKNRLLLWGIDESQIRELEEKGRASTHMVIHAPIGGTVVQKNALEGKYVKQGENLYEIADLSNVWVLADIYESELSDVQTGQDVEVTSTAFPGEKLTGKVSFIDPYLDSRTRTVKVRVDVPNPRLELKPGMYVNVLISSHIHSGLQDRTEDIYTCPMHPEIQSQKPGDCPICGMALVKKAKPAEDSILAVPKSAVLDTGVRKLVYIEKEEGVYIPKEVELGVEAVAYVEGQKGKFYAVKAGLSEGMRVVSQANFLIDSQSQLTGQAEAIYSGAIEADKEKKPPTKHIH